MTCKCSQCTETPDETYTEQHRHECEVREIAKHDGEWIKNYLDGIEKQRCVSARIRLRNDVAEIWKRKA